MANFKTGFPKTPVAHFFFLFTCLLLVIFPNLRDYSPWVSFLPVFIALLSIIFTGQAWYGLLSGSLIGALLLKNGHFFEAFQSFWVDYFFPLFESPWKTGAILFTLTLGSFARVLEKAGGFDLLLQKFLQSSSLESNVKTKVESSAIGLGLVCFFDGLANSLLVGRLITPLADRSQVTRAKLAYIVDSTSSSVACIAFISTWIATQLSLIQQSIEKRSEITSSAYALFFQSIPYNFYCLFTLILVILTVTKSWDIGPMKRTRVVVRAKQNNPIDQIHHNDNASLRSLFIPLIVLGSSLFILFYAWGTKPLFPITLEKITSSFGGNAGPYVMVVSSLLALATAVFLFPKSKRFELPNAIQHGAAEMLNPLVILVLAWCFGSILKSLGTATFLSENLSQNFPPSLFPAAVFLIGAIISFSTGSSWGTMGLLMPIALPTFLQMDTVSFELVPAVIASVFSGAVFGDHCSPFSDTTIVSAFACGIDAKEHVITQLPYALITAGISLFIGFSSLYFTTTPIVGLVCGIIILWILTSFGKKPIPS